MIVALQSNNRIVANTPIYKEKTFLENVRLWFKYTITEVERLAMRTTIGSLKVEILK